MYFIYHCRQNLDNKMSSYESEKLHEVNVECEPARDLNDKNANKRIANNKQAQPKIGTKYVFGKRSITLLNV